MRITIGTTAGIAALAVAACSAAAGDVRIATVDTARVMKDYVKAVQAKSMMDDAYEDVSGELKKLRDGGADLKKEFDALKTEAQDKALSEAARAKKKEAAEEKLTALMEYESKIRDTATARRKELEDQARRLQKRLNTDIRAAIAALAASNGFAVVLDSASVNAAGLETVLFSQTNLDVTDALLQTLNAGQPPVRTTRAGNAAGPAEPGTPPVGTPKGGPDGLAPPGRTPSVTQGGGGLR